jgi:hypothetical protein
VHQLREACGAGPCPEPFGLFFFAFAAAPAAFAAEAFAALDVAPFGEQFAQVARADRAVSWREFAAAIARQQLVRLKLEGLSLAHAARALGLSQSATRQRWNRLRLSLQFRLEEDAQPASALRASR